ncbi:maleylpyruvate isomerase family mycothiol-dependent enzyme [Nocardioides sp.]|uniref:maleylpyruvate isomerase family mycothiol-dependent enzyme n=1 Tax=Nocardioides sp. TaxID=35761 RepID=UPI0027205D8D|nr:maleylpyruvate isomerase family mycothiol-dependent enzyme [Nocardioides sp.]MDO9455624.1 maleylpyruvate isomerase family mycothiol-dependent enzyme [Nocardioides sp.]
MTLVDRVISSLRHHHDRLAALVPSLDDAALTSPSAATEWRVCDVLSHLGSGAEITLRPLAAAATGTPVPEAANEEVWDRWNAMSPRDQADGFVEHDRRVVETLEGLDDEARESLTVDLGFLPAPVPLAMAAGMRLNEVALHSWDVLAGLDVTDSLDDEAAEVLLELYTGPLGMLLTWASKPGELDERTVVAFEGHGLTVAEEVSLVAEPPVAPTATFTGPVEAAVRLIAGRLRPTTTPEGVEVVGNVTLDDLRRVFPGY